MQKRLRNFFVNGAHLLLAMLLVFSLFGPFPCGFAAACVTVSTLSMLLLITQSPRLLRTYYNRFSRIKYRGPVAIGCALCVIAFCAANTAAVAYAAVAELAAWLVLLTIYLFNARRFPVVGDGPLPANTWLNPPVEAMKPGYVVLMSGMISRKLKVSVGHMELILDRQKGSRKMLHTFTAYIEKGVIWHTARSALKGQLASGHYIALRPKQPWTVEQNDEAMKIALSIFEANRQWLARELPRRLANLERWFPESRCNKPVLRWFMPRLKAWFQTQYLPTGYDGISMRIGTRRKDQWTCQSAVTDVLEALGVPIEKYERGLLGLGTGALDLPNPIEFIDDSAYELLTVEHQQAFEASRAASDPTDK